jgi:hypothetical protein
MCDVLVQSYTFFITNKGKGFKKASPPGFAPKGEEDEAPCR